jgi:predicted acyltransferase
MLSNAKQLPSSVRSNRLVSLDVARGITIAFMILVNNGTGPHVFPPLLHAEWNGWTPTDLVFPTFLFLMGMSIVFSTESRLAHGANKTSIFLHTLRRFVILFLLGLVVNGFPFFHLGTLRIYGVLQRIAICFLIVSALYLWDRRIATKVVLVVVALVGYWLLIRWVPVPGYGMPGRDIPFMDKQANLTAYIDRLIFPGRLYVGIRDPEGLLSTLPALATTLLGTLTALWLRSTRSLHKKAIGMFTAGIFGIMLGEVWNIWFPINKNMWTSSYVLLAAGFSLELFAICYWVVEIKGWKRIWTYFWLVFGMNAITAYVFSELLASGLHAIKVNREYSLTQAIYFHLFAPIHPPQIGSLMYAMMFVLISWLPVAILYRKKIFIKV